MQPLQQMGGVRPNVLQDIQEMLGHFLLVGLVLVCVYVPRIPEDTLVLFRRKLIQLAGFLAVILITVQYGWIHGILAALAFTLLVSRALKVPSVYEGLSVSQTMIHSQPQTFIVEDSNTIYVPENHRWFVEKVLGENPFLIREKEVMTTAVQDLSEKSMGFSTVTK